MVALGREAEGRGGGGGNVNPTPPYPRGGQCWEGAAVRERTGGGGEGGVRCCVGMGVYRGWGVPGMLHGGGGGPGMLYGGGGVPGMLYGDGPARGLRPAPLPTHPRSSGILGASPPLRVGAEPGRAEPGRGCWKSGEPSRAKRRALRSGATPPGRGPRGGGEGGGNQEWEGGQEPGSGRGGGEGAGEGGGGGERWGQGSAAPPRPALPGAVRCSWC